MPKQKIKIDHDAPGVKVGFFWFKNKYFKYLTLSLIVGTIALSAVFYNQESPDFSIQAVKMEEKYPRLANLFFKWDVTDGEARELSKWDVLVIDMEAQINTPDNLRKIKEYNPQIKILAYITSQEFTSSVSRLKSSSLRRKLYSGMSDNWWLNSSGGGRLVWWPGTWLLNVTDDSPTDGGGKKWNDYLPEFVAREILSQPYWDGVFYDNAWDSVSWMPSGSEIDLNRDGQAESSATSDQKWREGMNKIYRRTRELAPGKIVMGNQAGGASGKIYFSNLNGISIEHFHKYNWTDVLNNYFFILNNGQTPKTTILNCNTENTGRQDDYARMRFCLASTLLGDGYFSFDYGDQAHNQTWWYDEYGVFLGKPINSAYNIADGSTKISSGVWRRDFQNGIVLVNSGSTSKTINLGEEFEKIHGSQDKTVNSGAIVKSIYLSPKDGIILLRRAEVETVSNFQNGSFARVFDGNGKLKRTGFFTYDGKYKPASQVMIVDLNQDGPKETVVADSSKVEIFDSSGKKLYSFFPYDQNYDKGINFAVGDLTHDGKMEIVTGTLRGGGPHVRIFNWQGRLIHPGFFAYGKNFRGGVSVAVGDTDGNGWPEIITGAGFGGGPHVRIFSGGGKLMHPGFFAYDPAFRGGVNVAMADLNDDGRAEIITGPGIGGSPEVKIFDAKDLSLKAKFFAFSATSRGGVAVFAGDLDNDGKEEIVAQTTDIFSF
ncbi:MAG: putative glycoside hydrolase [Patescibacteria group bacterium]